jgi:hypothetical protein
MPAKNKPEWEKKLQSSWPMLLGLAAVLLLIAYGFISWAIDSGNWLHYLLAIVFLVWAAKEIKRAVVLIFKH